MRSHEIRRAFLDFFAEKGHKIEPSAPLVIKNDPTLMFTNAGMNQFKDYFLGNKPAPYKRVADTQKCLRVSGKHNDLEEVGIDTYHHTMFEMLGNWSFGDYFKKEALEWSWELLTKVYGLPPERMYVSVFGGDAKENLASDEDARNIWRTMVPDSQILDGSKKDNFWEMGETGPCGPCSEIHIDLRNADEVAATPGRDLVNNDHPQVVEIWNNVFMEFNRLSDGSLQRLPEQHVDTGMGFERLCMAIQGKQSNYDTDVFQPMIQFMGKRAGVTYGENIKTDIALRVLSDHIRAIAFTIADGQLPSNNKAGYVIRRILRRAVRYYYNFLNIREPFLHTLVPILAEQFADVFPELKAQEAFVARVIQEEEVSFLRTLETGLKRLDTMLEALKADSKNIIPGAEAFELFDTYGFPKDLTALIARENGLSIDETGFDASMQAQKTRSRKDSAVEAGDWQYLSDDDEVVFTGYDDTEAEATITRFRKVSAKGKTQYQLVLNRTPFYAESGGQLGDTGFITAETNGEKRSIRISDTKKENDLIIHISEDEGLDNWLPAYEGTVTATIDTGRRTAISSNHSATHLLHSALRKVLGNHIAQKGSLVSPDVLRFDFSHFSKVTAEELAEVEQIVNSKIRENILLEEQRYVPIDEARNMGATALFGEKYGSLVRVITFDKNYSVELCGGTHVPATGKIGSFKLLAESSVAAGVRRIEAVTAEGAEQYVNTGFAELAAVKDLLKNPADVVKAVEALLADRQRLSKVNELLQQEKLQEIKKSLLAGARKTGNTTVIIGRADLPSADAVKQLAFEIKEQHENLFLVIGAAADGKPNLSVMLSGEPLTERGMNASVIVRDLAKSINGGGGGQNFFASAGGKDVSGLDEALRKAEDFVAQLAG
ncbi:MAG: alanine--tRNA ligase [Bacteroidota bacterium]